MTKDFDVLLALSIVAVLIIWLIVANNADYTLLFNS